MTGSGIALIIIPIASTISLAAWLVMVLTADSPTRTRAHPAHRHSGPGPAVLAHRCQPGPHPADPANPAAATPSQDTNTRNLPCTPPDRTRMDHLRTPAA